MVATTEIPRTIKVKDLPNYNGTPSTLDKFNTAVKALCEMNDYPYYYSGYVSGNQDDGFKYVNHDAPGAKSNHNLGRKLCAGIITKLVEPIIQVWIDYSDKDDDDHPPLNCWKKALDNKQAAPNPLDDDDEEVSLYDLLYSESCPQVSVKTTRVELARLRWNPMGKDADPINIFKIKVNKLL